MPQKVQKEKNTFCANGFAGHCISSVGAINLSICVPKQPPKVRKIQGGKKRKTLVASNEDGLKGTTAGHYMRFLQETLDILDQYSDPQNGPNVS
jgi:hypothetical protein